MARIMIHSFQPWAYRLAHPDVKGPVEGSSWEEVLRHLYDPFDELTRTEHSAMASIMVAGAANRMRAQIWNTLVDAGGQPMLDQIAIDALANETSLTTILEGRRWPWNVPLVVLREAYDLTGLDFPAGPHVEILSGWTARDAVISVARCGGWRIFVDSGDDADAAFSPGEARLISYDPARDGMPHTLGRITAEADDADHADAGFDADAASGNAAAQREDITVAIQQMPSCRKAEAPAPREFTAMFEDEIPPF